VELLGAGGESDTIEFTTTELLGGAAGTPGGGCAGPEDDGGPGSATPPVPVEEGGSDPGAAAGGAGEEVLPLTAGVPASAPAAAPGGGQLKADAPTAPAVPPLSADPTGAEHELPELSPDELTAGPPPEGAVLVGDGVVVAEDGGGGEGGAGEGERGEGERGEGEGGAVPASEPVPAEQSLDPAAVAEAVGGEQTVRARTAPDMAPRNRTHTANESSQILLLRRAGDGTAQRTMRSMASISPFGAQTDPANESE
jgi:hypothetical protein